MEETFQQCFKEDSRKPLLNTSSYTSRVKTQAHGRSPPVAREVGGLVKSRQPYTLAQNQASITMEEEENILGFR